MYVEHCKRYIALLLLLFFCFSSFGQSTANNDQPDSARFAKERARVIATYVSQPDSALIYSWNIVRWARQVDDVAREAWGLKMIGVYHQIKQGFDSALVYFKDSRELFVQVADTFEIANSDVSLAQMYMQLSEYDLVLEHNMMAMKLYEAIGNTQFINRVYENMGQVYSLTGEHEKALPYFHKSYQMTLARNDTFTMGVNLANFVSLHNYLKNEDSVIYYADRALPILNKTDNYFSIANVKLTLSNLYKAQGKFQVAEEGYETALASFKKTNAIPGMAYTYYNYGLLKDTLNRWREARDFYEEALKYSRQMGITDIALYSSERLKKVYANLMDFEKAFTVSLINDSLQSDFMDAEKQEAVASLQTQFDVKEKEQQIALQEATLGEQEAKLERNQVFIFGLIVIAVLLIAVLLLVRLRSQKEKALIKREAELKLREAEISAVINSQEKERNRFARDLHDGFGQMISVLKLNMGQLKDLNNRDLEKREEVFRSGEKVINDMYGELRNICFDLMPQTLVKEGLSAALKEFGTRVSQNTATYCEVLVFAEGARPEELVEISLFRIVQEWVNNVLKYAQAQNITIQLTRDQSELTLTVEDNGAGFDPNDFYTGAGNGWKNIQTRLKQINGDFNIESQMGVSGTMMIVNVALTNQLVPVANNISEEGKVS